MNLYKLSWVLWIPGTLLIVLSWIHVVSPKVGWVGFFMAGAGTLLSFVPPGSRTGASPGRGRASEALDDLAKLTDLRDRGAISEQEFWEKKKALMDRIGPPTP